jgi:membrane protein
MRQGAYTFNYFFMGNLYLKGWRLLKRATVDFFADDMPTYAAALAYRLLFSLFPFIIFLTTLLGFLGVPQFFGWMRDQAAFLVPGHAMDTVDKVLAELQAPQGGLMSVGIALAIWSASAGVLGTMNALNVAYDVKERRPAWKRFVVALAYTLALALMFIIAAAFMVSGPAFLIWLSQHVGLDTLFIKVWTWVRWPLAVFLLMLVVALVYHAAPSVKQPFRLITLGSVLAVTLWVAASLGFGFYVQNFVSYNQTYGSMSAVIVLLFYFFISAAVLLFGAELNSAIAREPDEPIEQE